MAHPAPPTPADRRLYGDLVDDVYLLRAAFKDVARFKGGYRVDADVVDAAGIRKLAAEVRARQQALKATRKPDSPRRPLARHSTERPKSPPALDTPTGEGAGTTDRADGPGSALANPSGPTCAKCGGPRSKWSAALCRACYVPAGRASDPAPPTADAPDKFARITPSTAGPAQGAASSNSPPDDAPHADRQEPPATPALAAGAGAGILSEVRQLIVSRAVMRTSMQAAEDASMAMAGETTKPTLCPCSRPKGHGGRCWVSRGMAGPPPMRRKQPVATCSGCEGPRSPSAIGALCRKCVLAKHRKSSGVPARIMALECEVDALKSTVERMRVQLAMDGGR